MSDVLSRNQDRNSTINSQFFRIQILQVFHEQEALHPGILDLLHFSKFSRGFAQKGVLIRIIVLFVLNVKYFAVAVRD